MHQSSQIDAKEVVEHLLQVTGSALLSGDFASFERVFQLPQVMAVAETFVRVEKSDDLRAIFQRLHEYFVEIGLTEISRTCAFAEVVGEDQIRATHVTELIAGTEHIQAPYPVNSSIVRIDGVWKIGSADYSVEPDSKQARAILRPHDRQMAPTGIFKKMSTIEDKRVDPRALEIYQANLDAVSTAIIEGPAEDALDHLRVPYFMRTTKGLLAFNNRQDILDGIGSARLSLRVQGATDYVRTARHAFFRSDTEIEGVHTTRILRGAELMTPPYENRMKLLLTADNKWQVIHAEHSVLMSGWPKTSDAEIGRLVHVDPLSQADEIARVVYQEYLDALTTSNMASDFDAWVDLCEFPHTVIIDNVTRTIETEDEIRPFFDMLSQLSHENPKARLKRSGEFATFINSHTIRGYHRSTFDDGENEVFKPVRGRFTISLRGEKWRMTETVNSIANTEFPYKTPIVSETLGSELDPKKDLTK